MLRKLVSLNHVPISKTKAVSSSELPMRTLEPMPYLEAFASLGPRQTCGPVEKEGAFYIKDTMEKLGLQVQEDRFTCNPRMFRPHMSIFLFVVAMGALPVVLPNFTLGLLIAALGCFYARKSYTDLLHNKSTFFSRILPKFPCRNIIGKIKPKGAIKNRIILLSHIDSAVCSPIFSPAMVKSLKTNIKLDRILFALMGALYIAAAVLQMAGYSYFIADYVYFASVALSLYVVGSLVVLLYSELFSPISPGANDNGSGVAAVLSFAEAFAKEPLENTELWCVSLGAEEPGAYGSRDLWENHSEELKRSYIINIDSVAIGRPRYLVNEGYLEEYKCDAEMISILQRLSQERPELGLMPYQFKGWGGYTDCTNLLRNGCKAISFSSMEANDLIKNWHTTKDTLDGIEKDTYLKVLEIVQILVHTLDQKVSPA